MRPWLPALVVLLLVGCGGTVRERALAVLTVVQADSLAFGNVLAGAPRALDVVLSNGDDPDNEFENLGALTISVTGAGLTVEHDCPDVLGSRERCTVRVSAAPAVAGDLAGTLIVTHDGRNSPVQLPVSGTAVAVLAPPAAAFAWGGGVSGAFDPVEVGRTAQRSFTVVNRGNATGTSPLRVLPADGPWRVTSDCGRNRGAGSTCTATVFFTPTEVGVSEATLELRDAYREGYAPLSVALRGSGL